jgi:hypothetical protein
MPAAAQSSYFNDTNVLGKVIDSTINQNHWIALATPVEINRTFVFHPFLETTPQQCPSPWLVQDTTRLSSSVLEKHGGLKTSGITNV